MFNNFFLLLWKTKHVQTVHRVIGDVFENETPFGVVLLQQFSVQFEDIRLAPKQVWSTKHFLYMPFSQSMVPWRASELTQILNKLQLSDSYSKRNFVKWDLISLSGPLFLRPWRSEARHAVFGYFSSSRSDMEMGLNYALQAMSFIKKIPKKIMIQWPDIACNFPRLGCWQTVGEAMPTKRVLIFNNAQQFRADDNQKISLTP